MRNFIIQLELAFSSETEAKNILESCGELMQGIEYDREEKLIKHLQEQVNASVAEMNKVVDEAKAKRPEIQKTITESNQTVEKIRQYRGEAEATINRLQETIKNLSDISQSQKEKLDASITESQKTLGYALSRLHDLDEAISQAKQRIEGCLFIKDMATAQATLLTSYKATLIGKDDLGNWAVKGTWGK